MKKKIYHKYKAKPKIVDDIKFHSTLEANYYQYLKRLEKLGIVLFHLRQTRIDLPGKNKYVCDFTEFHANGEVIFTDCKGMETETFKIKKKLLEEKYPIKLNIVKKIPTMETGTKEAPTLFTNREIEG